jgi:hypothetical protein
MTRLGPFLTPRGRCGGCGKVNWASRSDAKRFAKQHHQGEHVRAYRCGDFWHLGHLTAATPAPPEPPDVDGERAAGEGE